MKTTHDYIMDRRRRTEFLLKRGRLFHALFFMPADLREKITTADKVGRPARFHIHGPVRLVRGVLGSIYVIPLTPESNV